jgi:chromosome segregation ATPase
MNDLLNKLNVLLRSTVSNTVDSVTGGARPEASGVDPGRDAVVLRQRVNEAIQYEDQLQARLRTLESEVARWDEAADAAVSKGDDAAARYAVEQLTLAKQRAAMAESDLQQHRRVTEELLLRVNELEAAVADAGLTKEKGPEAALDFGVVADRINTIVDQFRDRVSALQTGIQARESGETATPAPPPPPAEVDDDLASRRDRLSKK